MKSTSPVRPWMADGLTTRTLLLALTGVLWAIAAPASPRAAECPADARKADVRIQLWKEPHCRGPWIEVPFEGDGDPPDFRRFRHSDGDTYDVDDNRDSAVVAGGHCVRFFTDPGYRGPGRRLRRGRRADRSLALPEGVSSMRACPLVAITLRRRRAFSKSRDAGASSPIEAFHFDRPGPYPSSCTGAALPGTQRLAELIAARWRTGKLRLGSSCVQSRPGVVDVHGEGRALDWTLDSSPPMTSRSATPSWPGCWPATATATATPARVGWAFRRSPGTGGCGRRRAGRRACGRSTTATAAAAGYT
jgi:hypothetical protein